MKKKSDYKWNKINVVFIYLSRMSIYYVLILISRVLSSLNPKRRMSQIIMKENPRNRPKAPPTSARKDSKG